MIKTYSYAKDGATKLTPHFRVREFRDKSGGDSFPLDIDLLSSSVKKTGRCVVVHEAHRTCGVGAEISSQLYEQAFCYLDAPIERLGAKQCPLPFNLGLENAVVPQPEDIINAVKRTLYK